MTEQPITWCATLEDGSIIEEFDKDEKETVFPTILDKRNLFKTFSLFDRKNNHDYAIDLHTGEFVFDGFRFSVGKEYEGRVKTFSNLPIEYNQGIIQFKCSKPVSFGSTMATNAIAATYNIGYKILLPENSFVYEKHEKGKVDVKTKLEITHVQAIICVDADTFNPTVTISLTTKIMFPDGSMKEHTF